MCRVRGRSSIIYTIDKRKAAITAAPGIHLFAGKKRTWTVGICLAGDCYLIHPSIYEDSPWQLRHRQL